MSLNSPKDSAEPAGEKASRIRQRQRLIEASISALYAYGPSRTTVEKVVSIANLSPGIVNFYFDSKAAMLLAALDYLAVEFERDVLEPVIARRDDPVHALRLLVDLYLDPEIASPRKVSVWFSFWGEATSRQEYFDICGKRDEAFAALVHDLIERLIRTTGAPHLEADGVALGLIGALEMMWQNFAFRTEATIDRADAKRRCIAFLRSVFPGQFGAASPAKPTPAKRQHEQVPADWQFIGHETEIPHTGDFLTATLEGERVLVVRDGTGGISAFRNACRNRPHALTRTRTGQFGRVIECPADGLTYTLDGSPGRGNSDGGLASLDVAIVSGLVFVRLSTDTASRHLALPQDVGGLLAEGAPRDHKIAASWDLVVETLLSMRDLPLPLDQTSSEEDPGWLRWRGVPQAGPHESWSARAYAGLQAASDEAWVRLLVMPNLLIDVDPDGAVILQVLSDGAGRSIIRRHDFIRPEAGPVGLARRFLARRLYAVWIGEVIEIAQSTQTGLDSPWYRPGEAPERHQAILAFRRWLHHRLPSPGAE